MRFFVENHPGVLGWLLVAALASAAVGVVLSRRLGWPAVPTGLLLAAVLLPLALTLTPSVDGDGGNPSCTTELRPYGWWGQGGEEVANGLMLVPLGVLAPLLLGRRGVPLLLLAACLPLGVEGTQYLLPRLGRACDVLDVLLNSVGLAAGTVVGVALRLLRRAGAGPSGSPGPPGRSAARSR